jgi:hypothetical protein
MPERDYVSTPVSDDLQLKEVVKGLANDLVELRAGKISPEDAHARAALAKQIWNGARIYLQAIRVAVGPGAQAGEAGQKRGVTHWRYTRAGRQGSTT